MSNDGKDEARENGSFAEAMATVFNPKTLEQFLHTRLDKVLSDICSPELDLRTMCVRVEQAAVKEGWITDLIEKARDNFPKRKDFQAVCNRLLKKSPPKPSGPKRTPVDRRLFVRNLVILAIILIGAAVWCARGPGLGALAWLGGAIGTLVTPLIGKLFEKENTLKRIADGLIGTVATTWMTWLLGVIGAGGFWASLLAGYVRVDSLPEGAAAVRVMQTVPVAPVVGMPQRKEILKLAAGELRRVEIPPSGRDVQLEIAGYKPVAVRIGPWNRLSVRAEMFEPLIVILVQLEPGSLLAGSVPSPDEEPWTIEVAHNGASIEPVSFKGDRLLIVPVQKIVELPGVPTDVPRMAVANEILPEDRFKFVLRAGQETIASAEYTVVRPGSTGLDLQTSFLK